VGDGGESQGALDDAFGIRLTVRSCCEKLFVKKSFNFVLCLCGFAEAAKFRDSGEFSDYV